jgi:DNA-binding MarR family transcriptional regulator
VNNWANSGIRISEYDALELKRILEKIFATLNSNLGDRPGSEIPLTGDIAPFPHQAAMTAGEEVLRRQAQTVFKSRQSRKKYLPMAMFGEVAWDILLYLYGYCEEGAMSVTALVRSTAAPMTTTLRWIDYLEKSEMIASAMHPTDARIRAVTLTDSGRAQLDQYFQDMILMSQATNWNHR